MSDRYSITRRSHDVEVEVDNSLIWLLVCGCLLTVSPLMGGTLFGARYVCMESFATESVPVR